MPISLSDTFAIAPDHKQVQTKTPTLADLDGKTITIVGMDDVIETARRKSKDGTLGKVTNYYLNVLTGNNGDYTSYRVNKTVYDFMAHRWDALEELCRRDVPEGEEKTYEAMLKKYGLTRGQEEFELTATVRKQQRGLKLE